tara:strand:- start:5986 stop:7794 length:1809 start_codon:yes stop_codon:yes gene_type:complete
MPIANFTVNPVTFSSEAGVDFTINNPTETLLLIPNAGYRLTAANFSANTPLPNYVDSVVFTQAGLNVNCIITYFSPSFMPSADVFVQVCSTGVAELAQFSVSGVVNFSGLQNVSVPTAPSQLYTVVGDFNSAANVATFTVEAIPGYFFPTTPIASLAIGNENRYSITSANVLDTGGNIIQTNFNVAYTFPSINITGDLINVSGIANKLYSPPIEIQAYTINTGAVSIAGATRAFTVFGVAGAAWNLTYLESVNNTLVGQFSGVIGSGGFTSVDIVFPSSAVDVVYTFTLTGDLSATFCTTFPYTPCATGQPSVWEILQITDSSVSFQFTSSDSNITVGPAASLSFPFGSIPGLRTYKVQASSPNTDFVWTTVPTAQSWTNQGQSIPDSNQVVQSPLNIVIENHPTNPRTLGIKFSTLINSVGSQDLLSILNLDNFLQGSSYTPISLLYGTNETEVCCNPSLVNYFIQNGETFDTAAAILLFDGSPAPDGFYMEISNYREQVASSLGALTVCPTCITYNSVVEVIDCTDEQGVATTIIEEGNIVVGTQLVSTSGGNITNLPIGVYRMSNNLTDGQTYNLTNILISSYIIQVDNNGDITSITEC